MDVWELSFTFDVPRNNADKSPVRFAARAQSVSFNFASKLI